MRPDLLAAVPRSAVTKGKSLLGQCVTSFAGHLVLGPMPGSWPAACPMLIELPGPCRVCWISSSCSFAEPGRELSVLASAPKCPVRGADMDLTGARHVTSDQLKLACPADGLAAATGR